MDNEYDIEEPTSALDSDIDMGVEVVEDKDLDTAPDNVVDTVQRLRLSMLLNKQPLDKDEMSLMNDLTRTAQTQQRINVENKQAESDSEIAKSLAEMVTSGISLKRDERNEKDITPPSMDTTELDAIEVKPELITTQQEEISIDEIMAAEDLKSDN